MKKLLLSTIVLLFAFQLQAQEVIRYSMEYLHGKSFKIDASEVKNGEFTYYIDCASWEGEDDVIGFALETNKVELFRDGLRRIKDKFSEWSQTAKENQVTDYDKDFDVTFPSVNCYFKYGKIHADLFKKPNVYFKVTSSGECLVIFSIKNLTAADNKYITHKGLFIAFSSNEEIDNFLNAIDPNIVFEKAQKEQEKDDLFN